jgi:hypothetical protein
MFLFFFFTKWKRSKIRFIKKYKNLNRNNMATGASFGINIIQVVFCVGRSFYLDFRSRPEDFEEEDELDEDDDEDKLRDSDDE